MPDEIGVSSSEFVVASVPHATEAGVNAQLLVDSVTGADSLQKANDALIGKEVTDASIREGVSTIVDGTHRGQAEVVAKIVQRHVDGGATVADFSAIRSEVYNSLKDHPAYRVKFANGINDPGVISALDNLIRNNPQFELVVRQELDNALSIESPQELKVERAVVQKELVAVEAAFDKADRDLSVAQAELERVNEELDGFKVPAASSRTVNKYTQLQELSGKNAENVANKTSLKGQLTTWGTKLAGLHAELAGPAVVGRTPRTVTEIQTDITNAIAQITGINDAIKDVDIDLNKLQQLENERIQLQETANAQSAIIETAQRTKEEKALEKQAKSDRIAELTTKIDQHDQRKKDAIVGVYKRASQKYTRQQISEMTKVAYGQFDKWQDTLPERHTRALSVAMKAHLLEEVDVPDLRRQGRKLWLGKGQVGTHKEIRTKGPNLQQSFTNVQLGGVDRMVRAIMIRTVDTTKVPPAVYTSEGVNQLLLGPEGPNLRKIAVASLIGTGELIEGGLSVEQKNVLLSTAEGEAILAESTKNEELMARVEEEARRGGFAQVKPKEKVRRAINLNPLLLSLLFGGLILGSSIARSASASDT